MSQPENETMMENNGRSGWLSKAGGVVLIVIIAYYLIVEHTAHLIQYAGFLAVFLIILLLVIVRYGIMNWNVAEKPPEG